METGNEVGRTGGEALVERLERHPGMKARIERVLDVLENTSGDLIRADEAERHAIDELRAMGQELLQGWAEGLWHVLSEFENIRALALQFFLEARKKSSVRTVYMLRQVPM